MTQKSLIINSPYVAPARHWQQARDGSLALVEFRRPASYEIFDIRNNTRRTEELERIDLPEAAIRFFARLLRRGARPHRQGAFARAVSG